MLHSSAARTTQTSPTSTVYPVIARLRPNARWSAAPTRSLKPWRTSKRIVHLAFTSRLRPGDGRRTPSRAPQYAAPSAVILSGDVPRRSERSLCLLLAIFVFGAKASVAQTSTLHVQFLNGNTGQPLKNLSVVINLNWPGVQSGPGKLNRFHMIAHPKHLYCATDADGIVSF